MSEADRGAAPLEALCQQVANLTQAVQRLQDGYFQLEGQVRHLATTVANLSPATTPAGPTGASAVSGQPAAPYPVSEPRVPAPERFSGNRKKFRAFKHACLLYLSLQPRTFSVETTKVGFVISLLSDEPQAWAHSLLEQKDPALETMDLFFEAMGRLYDDPQRSTTAEFALYALQQGKRPVEDYVVDFRKLASDSKWNEAALRFQFRQGLSEVLKDELAKVAPPSTLEGLILLATQLDRRMRERRAERSQSSRPAWIPPRMAPSPPTTSSTAVPASEGEPMQIGLVRPALTSEERLRRRQTNLCLYCGQPGHFLRNCSARPSKWSPRPPMLAPVTCPVPEPATAHLTLAVFLQVAAEAAPLTAILDSGACSCFLDLSVAQRLKIPLVPKKQPLVIRLADGSLPISGPVQLETTPVLTIIGDHHHEMIRFDVLDSPLFPVILGLPWLQAHDPRIQWSTGKIQLSSDYCLQHCQPTVTKGPAMCMTIQIPHPEVPAAYQDYQDVFDKKNADALPPHRSYDCPIELLPGSEIPFGRIFPLSEKELEALRLYLDENLTKGFIRPSSSPAGAGIFFVEKKDKTLRPCVDYRDLNKITVKNRYPLPLVPELFQRFRSAKVFTKLDLRGAYNLVRIRQGDEWKTAFRTRFGHFEYRVMPFGLCNAPATFQHLVNDIFREYLDHFVIVYLDDILIFSSTLDLHRNHVARVLATLRKHGLYAKAEKCEFEKDSIQFLGLIISTRGIAMDPQKVTAILDWPAPVDKKGVQRFVGFANFYRRFIQGFSTIISPITRLTQQHTRFLWSPEAQEAFSKLKDLFTSAPVLQHPDPALPFVLEVDASEVATGAILSQRLGSKSLLHPVAFSSRKLSQPERNYDVGDRELLAIKVALEEWRYLLEGAAHPITIYTDHKNLEYLRSAKRLRPRQARWALFFSRFQFHVTFRPGAKNSKADALSRMFPDTPEQTTPDTILTSQNFVSLLQPDLRTAISQATTLVAPQEVPTLTQRDGLLWHQGKVFVPEQARLRVLRTIHDTPLAGHFGVRKTTELLLRSFWWPSARKDCKDYVESCSTCQRFKGPNTQTWGLLKPLPIPEIPWKQVSMDFVVDLPPSQGHTVICVVIDHLSKMAHFLPMSSTPSAQETADLFIREVCRLHGLPSSIISDRGVQFTSKFWKSLCKSLAIEVRLSSAYHPQTNGLTERTNQTLEQYLRCFCSSSQDNWLTLLPCAEFSYNNSVHTATKQTPFWANYGFHPSFLPDIIPEASVPAVTDRLQDLQANYQMLQESIKKAQEDYSRFSNRKRRESPKLGPGDKVWLSAVNIRLSCPSRKLGPRFLGPFEIKREINPVAFELVLPKSLKIHPVFHVSLLKPAISGPFSGREQQPPPPVVLDEEPEYEVESVLDCRRRGRQIQYLIKWKGYPVEDNSWEPAKNLHAPKLLLDFRKRCPQKWALLGIRRPPLRGGHCRGRLKDPHLPVRTFMRIGARKCAVARRGARR